MSVCCMFRLIFVNKSMLTANIALLPTQIIRGNFRSFAIMSTSLHLEKVHKFVLRYSRKVNFST